MAALLHLPKLQLLAPLRWTLLSLHDLLPPLTNGQTPPPSRPVPPRTLTASEGPGMTTRMRPACQSPSRREGGCCCPGPGPPEAESPNRQSSRFPVSSAPAVAMEQEQAAGAGLQGRGELDAGLVPTGAVTVLNGIRTIPPFPLSAPPATAGSANSAPRGRRTSGDSGPCRTGGPRARTAPGPGEYWSNTCPSQG